MLRMELSVVTSKLAEELSLLRPGALGSIMIMFLLAVVCGLYTFSCLGAPALQRPASHLKACAHAA